MTTAELLACYGAAWGFASGSATPATPPSTLGAPGNDNASRFTPPRMLQKQLASRYNLRRPSFRWVHQRYLRRIRMENEPGFRAEDQRRCIAKTAAFGQMAMIQ